MYFLLPFTFVIFPLTPYNDFRYMYFFDHNKGTVAGISKISHVVSLIHLASKLNLKLFSIYTK